ncbi:MAG: ATP-binding cassette domain-containing protein, partial [Tepidiformaceae bacterium]
MCEPIDEARASALASALCSGHLLFGALGVVLSSPAPLPFAIARHRVVRPGEDLAREAHLLSANNVTKELGGRIVLAGVSLNINRGEVLGIVGPNGSGKTTLLRLLAGDLPADGGSVESPVVARAGYLPQGWDGDRSSTVGARFPALFRPDDAGRALATVAEQLSQATDAAAISALEAHYDALLAELSGASPGSGLEVLGVQARAALGLRDIAPATPIAELSGGELTKLGLLSLAASNPPVLLLDEPTNHLDLRGIEWVQDFIARFPGPAAIVSHDRALLDACATHILEIDSNTHRAETFTGDYSAYATEKARREEEQWERFRRQQREERQLRRTISAIESRGRNIENRTIDFYFRKRAAKVARRAVTLKARLQRQADSTSHVARPEKSPQGFYGEFA